MMAPQPVLTHENVNFLLPRKTVAAHIFIIHIIFYPIIYTTSDIISFMSAFHRYQHLHFISNDKWLIVRQMTIGILIDA